MKKIIKKAIEDHFLNCNFDQNLEDEILDSINIDSLVDNVIKLLQKHSLNFVQTPTIEGFKSEYYCDTCKRSHGVWVGENGVPVNESLLRINGKKIVIFE